MGQLTPGRHDISCHRSYYINLNIDNGKVTALTLLDLSAAFDTIGRASLARENEAGRRKSIFSVLAYRTSFCFGL